MKRLLFTVLFFALLIAALVLGVSKANAQLTAHQTDSLALKTPAFQEKVKKAGLTAAIAVSADTTRRTEWLYCFFIMSDPLNDDWILPLAYAVAMNPAINWTSTEADIQYTVNSVFARYAAIYYMRNQQYWLLKK